MPRRKKVIKRKPVRKVTRRRRQYGNGIISDFVNAHPALVTTIGATALGTLGALGGAVVYQNIPTTQHQLATAQFDTTSGIFLYPK